MFKFEPFKILPCLTSDHFLTHICICCLRLGVKEWSSKSVKRFNRSVFEISNLNFNWLQNSPTARQFYRSKTTKDLKIAFKYSTIIYMQILTAPNSEFAETWNPGDALIHSCVKKKCDEKSGGANNPTFEVWRKIRGANNPHAVTKNPSDEKSGGANNPGDENAGYVPTVQCVTLLALPSPCTVHFVHPPQDGRGNQEEVKRSMDEVRVDDENRAACITTSS
jgi:hypothetical protein